MKSRTELFKKLRGKVIECRACERRCRIKENRVGFCGVRKNIGGKGKLLVRGRAVAVNLDPIEKKPLFHFLPGSRIYSIGTVGCNFRCQFCQNWEISQSKVENFGGEYINLKKEKIIEECEQ